MANHVIIMQPYYTCGENAQEKYDAALTQAIGRSRRWGQEKEVHVYHFLTVNTIDVDYYEARTNTILSRIPGKPTEATASKAGVEWETELGTYFAKVMRFDDAIRDQQ